MALSVFIFFSLATMAVGIGEEYPVDCFDQDYDYPGKDLEVARKLYTVKNNAKECQALCARTDECKFFTYSTSNKRCYLKTANAGKVYEKGAISGHKECPPKICQTISVEDSSQETQIGQKTGLYNLLKAVPEWADGRPAYQHKNGKYFLFWKSEPTARWTFSYRLENRNSEIFSLEGDEEDPLIVNWSGRSNFHLKCFQRTSNN